ncbi:hypothetical protein B0T22DRAFT_472735 [Podospora appendiculata]|uniref:Uncharacterized protein n=1 Tax=Podospora appendiculata TaxID=314037 RepID=A0AAE1C7P0_9PEZI|nr:hypothetical protein B0T22DRAFT_472735 [Podospora appendiculata]
MARLTLAAMPLLMLCGTTVAQTLNTWGQVIFGIGGSDGHLGVLMVDGDPSTYAETTIASGPQIALLANFPRNYLGFYVQSSGDFLTDYYVNATLHNANNQLVMATVGQVCGATSNFTLVAFTGLDGQPGISTDTIFIYPTGAKGATSRINEVYPIFPGDTIFYPNNTRASCADQPSTTATVTSTSTPTTFVTSATSTPSTIPTSTVTSPPTSTPTIPNHSEIKLNRWRDGTNSNGASDLPIIDTRQSPAEQAAYPSSGLTDYDATTYFAQAFNAQPVEFEFFFNEQFVYEGVYIQSDPANYITDYSIRGWHFVPGLNASYPYPTSWTLGGVSGATKEWTYVRFANPQGGVGPSDLGTMTFTVTGSVDGQTARIAGIYPIYEGDGVVEI